MAHWLIGPLANANPGSDRSGATDCAPLEFAQQGGWGALAAGPLASAGVLRLSRIGLGPGGALRLLRARNAAALADDARSRQRRQPLLLRGDDKAAERFRPLLLLPTPELVNGVAAWRSPAVPRDAQCYWLYWRANSDLWVLSARPALPRSWDVFTSSLPDSNEILCMLNRQRELTLPRPTAAPTATSSTGF